MKKLFDYFNSNPVLITLILILLLIAGIYSAINLKREVFPGTETDTMIVTIKYPGASPIDIETNVIIPLEDQIKKIVGIKDYISISMENGARLYIYLQDDLSNAKEVKDEIIRELTSVTDLPPDLEDINIVNANPKRMSVYTFGITLKDDNKSSMKDLYDFYDNLEKKLKKLSGVADIRVQGYLDPEIKIKVDPFKINKYNISLKSIIDSINSRNIRSTGGTIQSVVKDKNIVTLGQFKNPLEVKNVIIRANYSGNRITINDIAKVGMGLKKEDLRVFINQKKGITVSIVKNEDADISKTIETVKLFLKNNEEIFSKEFNISTIDDRSLSIKALLNVVQSNAIIGFILVFIILFLFLNIKSAFWTAFGIPITIFITLIFMYFLNISLNIITLGAVITVLGMLVDDAIVISENIHYYRLQGLTNREAGFRGLSEVMGPVSVSIMTTIVAFMPLLAVKGKMGLFIKVFPVIIAIALLGSFIESVFFLPHHVAHGKKITKKKKHWFEPISNSYRFLLEIILKYRYITMIIFIVILAVTLILSINVFKKFVLIKDDSSDILLVNLEAPTGTNLESTSKLLKNIEEKLIKQIDPEIVVSFNSVAGHHKVKSIDDRGNYENWAQIAIYLVPSSERKISTTEIMRKIQKFIKNNKNFGFEKVLLIKRVIGPDPGLGLDIKIAGNKIEKLIETVGQLKEFISKINGITDIDDTNKPGKEEIIINFNYLEMAKLGLNVETVAKTVKSAYDGVIVTSFQSSDKKIDYRLELDPNYKRDINFLKNLKVPNMQGRLIDLSKIASFKTTPGISVIDHYNGDKSITITANTDNKIITPKEAMQKVKQFYNKELSKKYPGIYFIGKGEAAETESTLTDLLVAFIIALIGIFTVLVILFKDPVQPLLVLIVIPFGFVGAILAFILHNVTLSFMGMIGLIGLSGVVINDSVVMIEFINRVLKENTNSDKKTLKSLIAEGAKRRLRPIILTTLTTVGGLLPTVYGIGGKAESITPTVMAMSYGILFATLLTLFFLPSLYMVMLDIKGLFVNKGEKA